MLWHKAIFWNLVTAAIPSLIGAIAGKAGNDQAEDAQNAANALQISEAEKNREFQERMRNTAHQAEVKDLLAAGLNPILSAGGSGAVSPSGSVPTVYSTGSQYANTGSNVNSAIASGISNARVVSELSVNDAIRERELSQARQNAANADLAETQAKEARIKFDLKSANSNKGYMQEVAGEINKNVPGTAMTGAQGFLENSAKSVSKAVDWLLDGLSFGQWKKGSKKR